MKKIISILIIFSMLMSITPMAFAETTEETTENIITLNATETVYVGNKLSSEAGNYELNHCIGSTADFFDKPDNYGGYSVGGNRFVAYKVDVPESGRYQLTVNVTGTQSGGGDDVLKVYIDECLTEEVTLPNLSSYTDVDVCGLQLTKGTHILLISLVTGGNNMVIRNFRFTKTWDMEKIVFRAANYDSIPNNAQANPTNKFNGDYSNLSLSTYGTSSIIFDSAVLEFKLTIPETGTYKLSGKLGSDGGVLQVRTGSPWESSATIKGNFTVSTGGAGSAYRIPMELGNIELSKGSYSIYFCGKDKTFGYEYLSLELIPKEGLLDEINQAKQPKEIQTIMSSSGGALVNEMKYKMNNMFFPHFIGSALINKSFTSLEEVKTAFDEAYAKEGENPKNHNIRLCYYGSNGGADTVSVTVGSGYQIKIKENILPAGTQVIFARYTDESRISLKNAVIDEVEDGKELILQMGWINPGEGVGLFFWNSMETLTPVNIFFQ